MAGQFRLRLAGGPGATRQSLRVSTPQLAGTWNIAGLSSPLHAGACTPPAWYEQPARARSRRRPCCARAPTAGKVPTTCSAMLDRAASQQPPSNASNTILVALKQCAMQIERVCVIYVCRVHDLAIWPADADRNIGPWRSDGRLRWGVGADMGATSYPVTCASHHRFMAVRTLIRVIR